MRDLKSNFKFKITLNCMNENSTKLFKYKRILLLEIVVVQYLCHQGLSGGKNRQKMASVHFRYVTDAVLGNCKFKSLCNDRNAVLFFIIVVFYMHIYTHTALQCISSIHRAHVPRPPVDARNQGH